MTETAPQPEAIPSASDKRSSKAKWAVVVVAVIAVGGLVAAALVWRPWEPDEPSLPEVIALEDRADCAADAVHVFDELSGVCYTIPEDWVVPTEPELKELGLENSDALAHAPNFRASLSVQMVENTDPRYEAEEAARKMLANRIGVEPDASAIEVTIRTIDGRDSATASGLLETVWLSVTMIENGDFMIMVDGMIATHDPDLEAEVEQVLSTISLE
jgi:hypothetical protein